MSWADRLRDGSFRTVPFEATDLSDEGGRALVLAEFVGVDGAAVDDTGGRPRRGKISAVCFGPTYETQLAALLAAFNESGAGELVHPVFGRYHARVERWSVRQGADARDEASLDFDWVEDNTGTVGLELASSTPAAKQSALSLELARTEQLAAAHPSGPSFASRLSQLTRTVRRFTSAVTSPNIAVLRSATQILAEVQTAGQELIDAVRLVQNPDNQPLIRQVKRTLRTVGELHRLTAAQSPRWTTYQVRCWTTARLIAHELYGDAERATEIVRTNALRDPGRIGPGTELQVRAS